MGHIKNKITKWVQDLAASTATIMISKSRRR